MSDALPILEWNFSEPAGYRGQNFNSIFRQWHRAHLLGLELSHLAIDGHEKAARDIERLNLWIAGHGAWRCSSLPYWEGFRALNSQVRLTGGGDEIGVVRGVCASSGA